MSSIGFIASPEVQEAEREILNALRFVRDNAEGKQDTKTKNTASDMLSREIPRGFRVPQMLHLLHDCFKRGVPVAELEEVPAALSRALHKWDAERKDVPDFSRARLPEETAEGICDVKEQEFEIDPSPRALLEMERAHRHHAANVNEMIAAARREAFRRQRSFGGAA